jgi:NAD(P)-dependent dehydrogenase (short-subunit alcohol dehydrogenase family)
MTTILITGAGRGIGKELARQALDLGWDVIGSVRSVEAQRELANELPRMAVINFDVRDHEAVEKVANAFHRPIDVLVNNAGIFGPENQSTTDMDFDGFSNVMEVNVLSPLKVSQVFLPLLKESSNARIINISSRMGRMEFSTSDRIAYRASKAAFNKLTQAMATDFREMGISVIAMHPGWVQTDMGGENADITPQQSASGILKVIEGLSLDDTGKFIDWDGTARSW